MLNNTLLAKAIETDDIEILNQLPVDQLNAPFVYNNELTTPLHMAAILGKANSTKALLMKGANPNHALKLTQITPLHLASKNNHLNVTALLLDKKAHVLVQDENNLTPLHSAIANGNVNLFRLLQIHLRKQVSLLSLDVIVIEELMEHLARLSISLAKKSPAQMTKIFKHIITDDSYGIINPQHLHLIIEHGVTSLAQALLTLNVNNLTEMTNQYGYTAAQAAVINRDLPMLKILHQYGANLKVLPSNGDNLIHLAIKNNYVANQKAFDKSEYPKVLPMIEWLISLNLIDLNHKNASGFSPLNACIDYSNTKVARLLIHQPQVNIEDTNIHGLTSLMYALEGFELKIAQALIKAGAQVTISYLNNTVSALDFLSTTYQRINQEFGQEADTDELCANTAKLLLQYKTPLPNSENIQAITEADRTMTTLLKGKVNKTPSKCGRFLR